MTTRNLISLDSISRNRSALMGIAIIWVFLFHVGGLGLPIVDNVLLKGYLGVDIFFFLSGWGVCFSLTRSNNIKDFYKRRLIRIIPSWYIILTLMFVLHFVLKLQYPHNIIDLILYYTGIGYYVQPLFSEPSIFIRYYEWYIPTLLVFYLFAPLIYKLSLKSNIYILVISVICVFVINYYCFSKVYSLSYGRIPVYILGFIACKLNVINKDTPLRRLWVGGLIALILILLSYYDIIICSIEFLVVLLLMPLFLSIISSFINVFKFYRGLSFIGSISLELYLLHIYNRFLKVTEMIINQRLFAILVTLIALIGISLVINRLSSIISKKLLKA